MITHILDFEINQLILIKQLDIIARVDEISISYKGTQYNCAYFWNGELKKCWVTRDEIEELKK